MSQSLYEIASAFAFLTNGGEITLYRVASLLRE